MADVRPRIEDIAIALQRLVDHRAGDAGTAAEIEMVTAPLEELVSLVEGLVKILSEVDEELSGLDEEDLVRRLFRSNAKGAPAAEREGMLKALDRVRALEDRRAMIATRLLEATDLVERAVELGLSVRDEEAIHRREIELAARMLRIPE